MRELLRKYRGARTQAEMAAMYGVTQQVWSKWENGKLKPKFPVMKKIAHDAGQSIENIFFTNFNNQKEYKTSNKTKIILIEKEVS